MTALTDHGPGELFRYRVEGVNLNHPPCHVDRHFCWRVHSINYSRYDLSAVEAGR